MILTGLVQEFDGKNFVAIKKEGIEFDDRNKDILNRRNAAYKNKLSVLKTFMVKFYTCVIFKVEVSERLRPVPVIVSRHEYGQTPNMKDWRKPTPDIGVMGMNMDYFIGGILILMLTTSMLQLMSFSYLILEQKKT